MFLLSLIPGHVFLVIVILWLPVLLFAPIGWANGFWMGGALWLIGSAGIAVFGPGPGTGAVLAVTGQLFLWIILGLIPVARTVFGSGPGNGGTSPVIDGLAFIGRFITDETEPDQPPRPHPRNQHQPPWHRDPARQNMDRHPDDDEAVTRPVQPGNVFAGLDLDTDPLRDDDDQ